MSDTHRASADRVGTERARTQAPTHRPSTHRGSGDGWAAGPNGSKLWGRFGAAGLFLLSGDSTVLMQLRAPWTSQGGTWGIPGGARDGHESASQAAGRETFEECGIEEADVTVLQEIVTAGPLPGDPERPELAGEWTYTTVLATTADGSELQTFPNAESDDLRWVPIDELEQLDLLAPFAESLPTLRNALAKLG